MDQLDSFIDTAASLAFGPNPPPSKEAFAAILRERLGAVEAHRVDHVARSIARFNASPARD